jgi:hypothetical protein
MTTAISIGRSLKYTQITDRSKCNIINIHFVRFGKLHQTLKLSQAPLPLLDTDLLLHACTRVYPKYSGLVPPSIQQLWLREAPVYSRTSMSSESVCQVARSWVGVGSFHRRLVVMFMIFTASVRNILDTTSYDAFR